jgi:hypothetical protein
VVSVHDRTLQLSESLMLSQLALTI